MMAYLFLFVVLLMLELCYFKIADKFSIIDKPNERSSHSKIVLRGGGIIFPISMIVWMIWQMVQCAHSIQDFKMQEYLPFLLGLILISAISFWDDVHSLSDSVRLVVQFSSMALMLWGVMSQGVKFLSFLWYWQVLIGIVALIIVVGATNIINFMDGINGITAVPDATSNKVIVKMTDDAWGYYQHLATSASEWDKISGLSAKSNVNITSAGVTTVTNTSGTTENKFTQYAEVASHPTPRMFLCATADTVADITGVLTAASGMGAVVFVIESHS